MLLCVVVLLGSRLRIVRVVSDFLELDLLIRFSCVLFGILNEMLLIICCLLILMMRFFIMRFM